MNTSNYFPHNNNARSDEKLIAVRMDYGCEGYGIFFMILERLGESEDYTCPCNYKRLAFDFHCKEEIVQHIVEDYELFVFTDDDRFYSESYIERMQIRDEKREELSDKRRAAVNARWEKERAKRGTKSIQTDTNVIQNDTENIQTDTNVIQNDTNKSKVNKRKEKENIESVCVAVATDHAQDDIPESGVEFDKSNETASIYPPPQEPQATTAGEDDRAPRKPPKQFRKPTLQEIADYCNERQNGIDPDRFFNYYESNGWRVGRNPMRDWKAAVRNWERQEQTQTTPYYDNRTNNTTTATANAAEGKPYQRIQELGRTRFNLE